MPLFPAAPRFITLTAAGLSPGDHTLTDGYWSAQDCIIEYINVLTNSINWDLWLCTTSAFDITRVDSTRYVNGGLGDVIIDINDSYHPDIAGLYLKYTDNSGINTASVYVTGRTI